MSRAEIREAAGVLDALVPESESDLACRRVAERLFSGDAADPTHGAGRSRSFLPGWIGIAAVLALIVTGLAVFKAVRAPDEQSLENQGPIVQVPDVPKPDRQDTGEQDPITVNPDDEDQVADNDDEEDTENDLMFPGEAVIDSRLARLEMDLTSATGDAFWSSGSTLLEGNSQ